MLQRPTILVKQQQSSEIKLVKDENFKPTVASYSKPKLSNGLTSVSGDYVDAKRAGPTLMNGGVTLQPIVQPSAHQATTPAPTILNPTVPEQVKSQSVPASFIESLNGKSCF